MKFHFFDVNRHIPMASLALHFIWWDDKLNFHGESLVSIAANMGLLGTKAKPTEERIGEDIQKELFLNHTPSPVESDVIPECVADKYTKYKFPASCTVSTWVEVKVVLPNTVEQWKKEGKCPQCGELGKYINLGATCSKHGLYT